MRGEGPGSEDSEPSSGYLFLEDYFTSLSSVPSWGIALIKRTAVPDSLENYVCKLFGPGPALNGRSINVCYCRVVSGARGLDAD